MGVVDAMSRGGIAACCCCTRMGRHACMDWEGLWLCAGEKKGEDAVSKVDKVARAVPLLGRRSGY